MSLDEIFTISSSTAPPSSGPLTFHQLTGPRVTVRPLTPTDIEPLFNTTDESTFKYMWFGPFPTLASFTEGLHTRASRPTWTTHVFISNATSRIIGSASYHQIDPINKTVEIGAIWVGEEYQGKGLAREAVALMVWQAFRLWGFVRVEWKTHHENTSSQALALSSGMQFEGKFRKHMYYKGGFRHTMWYAVVDDDYPEVETRLLEKLKPK
ncbi:hypothetical protein HK097_009792 [Rhizophlyctis rosea]|uniref:N-acetyltransferase domain-containing protein n=1 Tax=Rhizophlyctis rosea TaxID=64517 RepID=A0AAD5X3J7_9FUNG|nr:hypothetical protein HK097_009792 [Rhizophlyctis rosea]